MARRRAREANIFNFSFLDILACTIGALIFILVMVIINNSGLLDASALEKTNQQLTKRESSLKEQIEKAKVALKQEQLLTKEAKKLASKPEEEKSPRDTKSSDNMSKEAREYVAKLEAKKRDQKGILNSLHDELNQAKAEVKRLEGEKAKREYESRQSANFTDVKPVQRRRQGVNRIPIHIACYDNKVVVYPEKVSVPVNEMSNPHSVFRQAIKRVERNRGSMCMVFWVYPNGIHTFKAARSIAESAGIGVGWEPASEGWKLDL